MVLMVTAADGANVDRDNDLGRITKTLCSAFATGAKVVRDSANTSGVTKRGAATDGAKVAMARV